MLWLHKKQYLTLSLNISHIVFYCNALAQAEKINLHWFGEVEFPFISPYIYLYLILAHLSSILFFSPIIPPIATVLQTPFLSFLHPFIPPSCHPCASICLRSRSFLIASLHLFVPPSLPPIPPSIDRAVHDMSQWLTATNWLNPTPGGVVALWLIWIQLSYCPAADTMTHGSQWGVEERRDSEVVRQRCIHLQDTHFIFIGITYTCTILIDTCKQRDISSARLPTIK